MKEMHPSASSKIIGTYDDCKKLVFPEQLCIYKILLWQEIKKNGLQSNVKLSRAH